MGNFDFCCLPQAGIFHLLLKENSYDIDVYAVSSV